MIKLSSMRDIVQIASRDNTQVKEARRVRDGKGLEEIFVEGARLVAELARSATKIDRLFLSSVGLERNRELVSSADAREIYLLADRVFDSISDTVNSQGLVAIARRPTSSKAEIENQLSTAAVPLLVFLYQTNNPSNLGAVIRTAEAAGAAGVIVSTSSTDAFSPKALRAAMGSTFRLPIWPDVELAEAIEWARGNDLSILATEIGAEMDYTEVDWKVPSMVVLGSEAHGLPEAELHKVDKRILISMERSVESLNLAVASGVLLFEARRQNSVD